MRRFIGDIVLFCGLLLLFTLGVDVAYHVKLHRLRLDPRIAMVILGDSHTQSGLDDSLLPHALNISHSEEHLLWSYEKLELILPRNPGVTTVVLGVSFHTFSSNYDSLILRSHRTPETYPTFFPMLDLRGRAFLLCHDPGGVVRSLGAVLGRQLHELTLARGYRDYSFWGYYYQSTHHNLTKDRITRAIHAQYYERNGDLQGYAAYQILYLKRIVQLCAERRVRLVLVNLPISPEYAARVPKKFVDNYYATVHSVAGNGVAFLDYHDLALPADWFGDAHHVNALGAAFVTPMVAADIAKAH